jgi:AcrR family transcriptional regulator
VPKVSPAHMQARRQQILAAAMACFTRNGVHPTSVQDICREAGISIGGLYRHFPSKWEIIEALFAQGDASNHELLDALQADDRPPEELEQTLQGAFRRFAEPGGSEVIRFSLAMHAEAARDERIAKLLAGQRAHVSEAFAAGVAEAQGRGALPAELDPVAAATVLLALFEGLKPQMVLEPDLDVARFAAAVRALLFR